MREPEKILFVISGFGNPNAGTESQLLALVKGLDRQFFTPQLLVFNESEYLRTHGFPCDYEVLGHSSILSLQTWKSLWTRARQYREQDIKLAHVFFIDPSIICPPVFRIFGIKTIISRRDMGYWYTTLYRSLLLLSGRFVSKVVANSRAVKDITRKAELQPESKIKVIHNGYLDGQTGSDSADTPASLPVPGSAVVAIVVANIRPIKRIQDAVEAVALARKACPDLHLVLVGSGDPQPLKRRAKELGIEDNVHFLGRRDDVKALLKQADIGVLCSESEGFSNSIVEYMQASLPVICSAVGGNPEAISDGKNGYLFPSGDISVFSSLLEQLSLDPELRQTLGINARRTALERFSMQVMLDQYQDLYTELLQNNE